MGGWHVTAWEEHREERRRKDERNGRIAGSVAHKVRFGAGLCKLR